jgi:hypothetical protein
MGLPGPLSKWQTAKMITIHDARLGVGSIVLKVLVVFYVLWTVFDEGAYNWEETPNGAPIFWFETGNLYSAQDTSPSYCSGTTYDYQYSDDVSSYWNDKDIECETLHYGQIVSKSANNGFVSTYVKEEKSYSRPCSQNESTCPSYLWSGEDVWLTRSDKIRDHHKNMAFPYTCTCARLTNFFVHSAEMVELHIEHTFWATLKKVDVKGSSTYKDVPDDPEIKNQRKNIKTCLKKKGMEDGECFKKFEPGETMSLRLSEWMELAGVSLDERLTEIVSTDKKNR